jgi:tetratricopeptide (TPR) repeat protein
MSEPQSVPPTSAPEAASEIAATRDERLASGLSPPAVGPDARAFETRSDSVLRLRDTGGTPGDPNLSGVPGDRIGPYEVFGEIGRGGMGAVLRGRDPNLGRDLALKVLLADHCGRADVLQRFHEEAQIGGQLQHPGVVPVYELGRSADGLPFFTMKLVRGQTLASLLQQRTDPAQDRPRFLQIFEQVCQTVAYAHARGVIHRDLKPANVMVGAFGEVQVMDWGLAKVLGRGGEQSSQAPQGQEGPAGLVHTDRSGRAESHTQAGSLMGTPAYMPPEQARGEVGRLDERCDVFSLGAMLCEVLIGRPPYRGSLQSVLKQAQQAELSEVFALLDDCGADAELVVLARRCLAAEPGDRPRDAGEVAAAVAAYRSGVEERARRAELERAAAQARAEEAQATAAAERRARRLTLGLGTAVGAVLLLVGSGAWWIDRQRSLEETERARRQEQMYRDVEAGLGQATALRRQSRWDEVQTVLDLAARRTAEEDAGELRGRIEQARAELNFAKRLDTIRQGRSLAALVALQLRNSNDQIAGLKRLLSEADFQKLTRLVGAPPLNEHTLTIQDDKLSPQRASEAYAAAFREYGQEVAGGDIQDLARRLGESPLKEQVLAALDDWAVAAKEDRELWTRLWRLAEKVGREPWRHLLRDPAVWKDRERLGRAAVALLRERVSPSLLAELGNELDKLGGDALALLEEGCRRHPDDFWLSFALANTLAEPRRKRWEEALGHYHAALAVRPDAWAVHFNLGNTELARKNLDRAIAAYHKAIELSPGLGDAYSNLGAALDEKGDTEGALKALRRAIEIDPRNALAHNNLGAILNKKGNKEGALAAFRQAIDLDPKNHHAHSNLGKQLSLRKDWTGALAAHREAARLAPDDPKVQEGLAGTLFQTGNLDGAIGAYRKAAELDPSNARVQQQLGNVLGLGKDFEGSVAAYRKALALNQEDTATVTLLIMAYSSVATERWGRGNLTGAIVACRKTIELEKDASVSLSVRVILFATSPIYFRDLRRKGGLDGAIAELRQLVATHPQKAAAHTLLAVGLQHRGRLEEARDSYRRALELFSADDPTRADVSNSLRDVEQLLKAEARLPAVLKGEARPRSADEWVSLARSCEARERLATAARLYVDAFKAGLKPTAKDYSAAARAAVRAATGEGTDTWALDEKDRAQLLQHALTWMQAALGAWGERTEDRAGRLELRSVLMRCQKDPDFATVREKAHLDKLPPAEGVAWGKFWASLDDALAGDATGHYRRGRALAGQGKWAEAEAAYRRAIELGFAGTRESGMACKDLGAALLAQSKWAEAEAAYRKAIEHQSDDAQAHWGLGVALLQQKKLPEALTVLKKADQLQPRTPNIQNALRLVERWIQLDRRLPAILAGEARSRSPQESIDLASFCAEYKQTYRAAVRFYSDAFTAEPKLAQSLDEGYRYNAACAAVLAAAGQGQDAANLDEKERARLRRQALEWLRADLIVSAGRAEKGDPAARQAVQKRLTQCLGDADLASVRDEKSLAALPQAEREAWQKLWADVAALLKKVGGGR